MHIYGSGAHNYANTAQVNDLGQLHTFTTISGIPQVGISGGIHIGSVSANVDNVYIQSGANILGSMGVTVVVPGIGATNLGKAEDEPHTTGDVGVMMLAVRKDDMVTLVNADGDYTPLLVNEDGILRTQAQQHLHIDECEATTGWSVLGNDTINLATTTNHTWGTNALEFDKVDGAANTIFAGIQKTLTSIDMNAYEKGGGFFLWNLYISTTANIAYTFLRVGTDNSNYNEFRISVDSLAAGWNPMRMPVFYPSTVVGTGWNSAAITYISTGVAFDDEANTLADIAIDHISVNTGLQTSSDITAQISSAVSSPNVIVRTWGNAVDTNIGVAGENTLRTVLATDQPRLAGSIVNMPPITGSVAITNQYLGSETWVKEVPKTEVYTSGLVVISGVVGVEFSNDYVNVVQSGTEWYVSGDVNVNNRVGGSIVNWPGSLAISNFAALGSRVTQGTTPWVISGVISNLDEVSVTAGSQSWIQQVIPTDASQLNAQYTFVYIISGTATGVTGSSIGSIYMNLTTGSYSQSMTYVNDNLTTQSSWKVV